MANMIIRDLPEEVYGEMKRMARQENLSLNQVAVHLLGKVIRTAKKESEADRRSRLAVKRLRAFRERMARKYGLMEDSTKDIREWRDSEDKADYRRKIFGE